MRYPLTAQTAAAAIDHPRARVLLDYATRARTEDQRRQRREAAWAVLSLVTLVLCWDLSARLDERVLGSESMRPMEEAAAEPRRYPGSPRRLRRLAEEAEGEAPKTFDWTK